MESVAGTMLNKQCDSRKNRVTGLFTKRLRKVLHFSCPVALSQHCAGSCPNLMMNTNDTLEPKMGSTTSPWSQSPTKAHRALCLSLSSDGTRQDEDMISHHQNLGDQMKQAHSGETASSRESLEQASLFCTPLLNSLSKSTMFATVESPSRPKSTARFSLFSLSSQNSNFDFDSSPLCISDSEKSYQGRLKSGLANGPKPSEVQGFSLSEPIITRVMDCIYVGNLCAAYSGQTLCKNNIDSIIDMSSLPSDCTLNFIPCTCSRGLQHSWSRLKVHIQEASEYKCISLQQPCFQDINECIEATLEKRKQVLIHCRDGYSLAPMCVIQYLMVKHSMRLLAAYEFVRARYPLNIQECHQDLLVGLERALWPGEMDTESFKQAMSRKMAWT